jgi:hypothetical protein
VEALVCRAELALGPHDPETAAGLLSRAAGVPLDADETERAASALENAADLRTALSVR